MIKLMTVTSTLEMRWKELIQQVIAAGWNSSAKSRLLAFEYNELLPLGLPYVMYDEPAIWMEYTALPWSTNILSSPSLDTVRESLDCFRCPLAVKQHVIGGGNIDNPKYAFIGDAPGVGSEKDIIPWGTTFCNGPTSRIIRTAAYKLGILHQSYFSNMLKCPLPGNRPGKTTEYANCRQFVTSELQQFPGLEIIFSLGKASFSKLRNITFTNARLIPLLHPSYFLRSSRTADDDFLFHMQTQLTPEVHKL